MKVPPCQKSTRKKGQTENQAAKTSPAEGPASSAGQEPWPEPSCSPGSGALAFSPSKNNSSERSERRAPNWNQLSKLPAGSSFRSLHQPFWERAIKNSERLKAPSPLPVLPLRGEDTGSRVWRAGVSLCSAWKGQQHLDMELEEYHGMEGDSASLIPGERGQWAQTPPGRAPGAVPALSPAGCGCWSWSWGHIQAGA